MTAVGWLRWAHLESDGLPLGMALRCPVRGARGMRRYCLGATMTRGLAARPAGQVMTQAPEMPRTRVLGRITERQQLAGWWADVIRGERHVAIVHGAIGYGAPTIARSLAPVVAATRGVMVGARCPRTAETAYAPWGHILWQLAAVYPELLADAPDLQCLVACAFPVDGRPEPTPAACRPGVMMDQLRRVLHGAAARAPLYLIVDDMQVAGEGAWEGIRSVLFETGTLPLGVVLTSSGQEGSAETRRRMRALEGRDPLTIELHPFTRSEIRTWGEEHFGGPVADALVTHLFRLTGGAPLDVAQTTYLLEEVGGVARGADGTTDLTGSAMTVATHLDARIAQRVDLLPPAANAVVQALAVADGPVTPGALATALGIEDTALARLLGDGGPTSFVREVHHVVEFVHPMLKDVVREMLDVETTQGWHRAWLRAGDAGRIPPSRIARHALAVGDRARALAASRIAAERARRFLDDALQLAHCRMALAAASAPADVAAALAAVGRAAEAVHEYTTADDAYTAALNVGVEGGAELTANVIERRRVRVRVQLGTMPTAEARDILLALAAEAEAIGAVRERIACLLMLSRMVERAGDAPASVRIAAETVQIARAADDLPMLARAEQRLGGCLLSEQPEMARAHFERALLFYAQANERAMMVQVYNNLGIVHTRAARWRAAHEAFTEGERLGRSLGLNHLNAGVAFNHASVFLRQGDGPRAKQLLERALSICVALQNSEYELAALYNLAHVEREFGVATVAYEMYGQCASLAERIGQADIVVGARAARALMARSMGRVSEAVAEEEAVDGALASLGSHWFQGREFAEAMVIRRLVRHGDVVGASRRLLAALALADPVDRAAAAWLCGTVRPDLARAPSVSPTASATQRAVSAAMTRYAQWAVRNDYPLVAPSLA